MNQEIIENLNKFKERKIRVEQKGFLKIRFLLFS